MQKYQANGIQRMVSFFTTHFNAVSRIFHDEMAAVENMKASLEADEQ